MEGHHKTALQLARWRRGYKNYYFMMGHIQGRGMKHRSASRFEDADELRSKSYSAHVYQTLKTTLERIDFSRKLPRPQSHSQ